MEHFARLRAGKPAQQVRRVNSLDDLAPAADQFGAIIRLYTLALHETEC